MDLKALKKALRREALARIEALSSGDRQAEQAVLVERFGALPGFERAATVLLYVSAFPEEIATGPMLRQALALGKWLICPRVDRAARRLRLHRIVDLDADLAPGALGIPEPRLECPLVEPGQVDWVLVPGLAFDDRRHRLGRGGGYYDRLLPTLRPDAPRVALAFDCQWFDELPAEPHDQRLDLVVSPTRSANKT